MTRMVDIYWKWMCKNFTDENKEIKWCPQPGCEYCILVKSHANVKNPVECECGTAFCVICQKKAHEPVDCEVAQRWEDKNTAESENVTWIMANCKTCPNAKCKKPIEKNQGCNHMTCRSCGHDFCWVCLDLWKNHGSATGGYYKCNKFEDMKKDKEFVKKQTAIEESKNELARYTFHFERYMNHEKAEAIARKMIPVMHDKIE